MEFSGPAHAFHLQTRTKRETVAENEHLNQLKEHFKVVCVKPGSDETLAAFVVGINPP